MKKILSLVLVLLMLAGMLLACQKNENEAGAEGNTVVPITPPMKLKKMIRVSSKTVFPRAMR